MAYTLAVTLSIKVSTATAQDAADYYQYIRNQLQTLFSEKMKSFFSSIETFQTVCDPSSNAAVLKTDVGLDKNGKITNIYIVKDCYLVIIPKSITPSDATKKITDVINIFPLLEAEYVLPYWIKH